MTFVMPDGMTIRTPDLTFRDFFFGLTDAFGKSQIDFLVSRNMVKMECSGVRTVSAVNTSLLNLVIVQEFFQQAVAFSCLLVYPFSVSRNSHSTLPTPLGLHGIISAFSWSAIGLLYFFRIAFAPTAVNRSRFIGICFSPLRRACIKTGYANALMSAFEATVFVIFGKVFVFLADIACVCGHIGIIPDVFYSCKPDAFYPCRSDIFDATYEPVEE